MKKKIFILLLLLLCVGCRSNYSIKIDKDGKVETSAYLTESKEFFDGYAHSSTGRVISFILEPYLDKLNSNNYEVNNSLGNENSGVIIKKTFNDWDSYIKDDILYSQFTDNIDYKKNGSIVKLKIKGKLSSDAQNQSKIPVKEGNITIELPFKVKSNNADKVSGNTYLWNLESGVDKEIVLEYDVNKLNKSFKIPGIVIFLIIIISILIILFLVYNKISVDRKKANNI